MLYGFFYLSLTLDVFLQSSSQPTHNSRMFHSTSNEQSYFLACLHSHIILCHLYYHTYRNDRHGKKVTKQGNIPPQSLNPQVDEKHKKDNEPFLFGTGELEAPHHIALNENLTK